MKTINYQNHLWAVEKSKRGSDYVILRRKSYQSEFRRNRNKGVLTALEVKMSEIGFGKNYKFV